MTSLLNRHSRQRTAPPAANPADAPVQLRALAADPTRHGGRPDQPSTTIGDLVREVLALPDLREDRIASLSRAIAAGTYHIPATRLADALIDDMLVSRR